MLIRKAVILGLGMAAIGSVNSSFAADEASKETKIALVDMQKSLQSVEAGKKAKTQLEKDFNTKKKMLQDEESAIRKLTEEFKKQSLVMNDESKGKKQQEIQERIMKFQENTARSQSEIQQKESELTAPIVKNLRDLIKEVSTKKGVAVVLDKNEANVLFSLDSLDMTQDVINAYNAKYK
jgi:outer membrane protein